MTALAAATIDNDDLGAWLMEDEVTPVHTRALFDPTQREVREL